MAVDVLLIRDGNKLSAADTLSAEAIAALDHKRQYVATIRQPRNLKFHRKFFAMLALVFENQSQYATKEMLLDALKIAVGHFDLTKTFKGTTYPIPRSINFASMSNDQFTEFYNRAVSVVLEHIVPMISRDSFDAALAEILGDANG